MTGPHATAAVPPHLMQLSPWRSGLAFALDWLVIAACFASAMRWPHPAVYAVAAIVIARTQLALAVLMHEGAHGLLARTPRVNDALGQWFAAGPLLVSMFAYRRGHLQHHRAPMAADDPVATLFGIADYPVSRRELAWRLFKDLTGIGYLLTVRDIVAGKHTAPRPAGLPPGRAPQWHAAVSIAATQAGLLGVLVALGHPWLYAGLWLLPALTFLQLFARVRAITEHAGHGPDDDQVRNARSIVRPSWQTFFCGPHGIHFHMEHHHGVRVPFYRLPDLHAWMNGRGLLPAANLYRGYGAVLREVSRARDAPH